MKSPLFRALTAMAIMMVATSSCAQVSAPDFEGIEAIVGYEITKDIKVSRHKGRNAAGDMKIESGRVCTKSDYDIRNSKDSYSFELIDCAEYLVLGKSYIEYYEPAQEDVPARYASREAFNRAAKKVYVYMAAPQSWKEGDVFKLTPIGNEDAASNVIVKPVVIKDSTAVFITGEDSCMKRSSLYGKTVYELTYCHDDGTTWTSYSYNGKQLLANRYDEQDDHWWSFGELMVDKDGYCHVKDCDEDASYEPWSELGPVSGEYPGVGLVGWLSATRMVIDDCVYNVVK